MLIETERLALRELAAADWPAIDAYQQDERYWRYYEREGGLDRRELLQRLVNSQEERPRRVFQLAVTVKSDGRLIGNMGIRLGRLVDFGAPDAAFEADIGYELDPAHWRQGFATEAASAMLEFAFTDLNVHRVWAACLADHERSWRLLERLRFRREGHLRENEWMQGGWWDTFLYGLLAAEWETLRGPGNPAAST